LLKEKTLVDKKTGEFTFTPGGNRWYVRHLDKSFTLKNYLHQKYSHKKFLEKMEPIVNDYFRFKSIDEIEEVEKNFNKAIEEDEEDETNGFSDISDAEDIFG